MEVVQQSLIRADGEELLLIRSAGGWNRDRGRRLSVVRCNRQRDRRRAHPRERDLTQMVISVEPERGTEGEPFDIPRRLDIEGWLPDV